MKTLYLLRHAKSDSTGWSGRDFERPLNERGKLACGAMAAHLREQGILPAIVLCSTAERARATLAGIAAVLGWPGADDRPTFDFRDELYLASENELMAEVRALDDSLTSAMVIGHNPGLEIFAIGFVQGSGRGTEDGGCDAFEALERKYPTAALATLTFDLDRWRDLGTGTGQLTGFVRPSKLKAAS